MIQINPTDAATHSGSPRPKSYLKYPESAALGAGIACEVAASMRASFFVSEVNLNLFGPWGRSSLLYGAQFAEVDVEPPGPVFLLCRFRIQWRYLICANQSERCHARQLPSRPALTHGGIIVDRTARPPPEGSTSQIHLVTAKRVFRRYSRWLRVPK